MKAEGIIPTSEGPIYVPRQGLKVMYSTNCIHMRKDLWGDDAEDFDPQRWLDDRTAGVLGGDSSQFLPFHAGPRRVDDGCTITPYDCCADWLSHCRIGSVLEW